MVLKKREPKIGRAIDPLGNPSESVAKAHALLKQAVEKSYQVPNDVVVAITDAHHSVSQNNGGFTDAELETRFWNAYGLLSSIKPVEMARRRYKSWFYVLLVMLLGFQLYYLAGSLINKRLSDIEAEWQRPPTPLAQAAASQAAPSQPAAAAPAPVDSAALADAWAQLRRRATTKANYVLGAAMMPWFTEFPADPPRPADTAAADAPRRVFSADIELAARNYMKMKGELEVVLCSLSGYILPLLYGALGAFAFILRKLSDPVGKLTYAYDTRVSYTLRVHIGALGGLAVGWFINGNSPISGLGGSAASGLVALSPLALAFVAGYGSDLLFTALDKVVAAFSPLPASQAVQKTETTFGGMTVTTETQREARVASGAVSAPVLPEPEATPEPGKTAEPAHVKPAEHPKTAEHVKPHEPRPKAA